MKLIDSNVVIYSVGREHEYRESARAVMIKATRGQIDARLDVEALQEVLNVYHRRRETEKALRVFDDLVASLPVPFAVTDETMRLARTILQANPGIQSRDAVHAAIVFEHNLEGIISADRAFDGIAGLKRFDPKELAA